MTANHEYCYWQDKVKMLTDILDAGAKSTRAYGLILKFCTVYWVSWDIRTAKLMNSKKTFFRATHCAPFLSVVLFSSLELEVITKKLLF